VSGLILRDGEKLQADAYVSAVPFFILKGLLDEKHAGHPFFAPIKNLESSPIFSISLWFDRKITDHPFLGLLDTQVQWLFNKNRIFASGASEGYVTLVISGAHEHLGKSDGEVLKMALAELYACLPESRNARLRHSRVVREKNATLSPKVGSHRHRLPQRTPVTNLFLCGDWTATGFPATIESACASGFKAARAVLEPAVA
jgi:zeta-carotene desaturase